MIILGSSLVLNTEGMEEIASLRSYATQKNSILGHLVTTQSQYVRPVRSYNIIVDQRQKNALEAFIASTYGPFDFVDHRAFSWLTGAGTDDDTHAYNTGAYFAPMTELVERPQQANGENCTNRWQIQITFIVNARGYKSNSASPSGENVTVYNETPSGTINSINDTFTLTVDPVTLILFLNGQEQKQGVDYTLSGQTITFLPGAIPQTGSSLDSYYTL